MTKLAIDPSSDIPEEISAALAESSDSQLRATIEHAQRLLGGTSPVTDAVEAREGEEILSITDHGAYMIAVVDRSDETGTARGPFAYRVNWEPGIEGRGQYRWHYLGEVSGEPGGGRRE